MCSRPLHAMLCEAVCWTKRFPTGNARPFQSMAPSKVCLPLLGQGKFSEPSAIRNENPFAGEDAYTRVITIRGRSGAVLGMGPAPGETGSHIAACLTSCLPHAGLVQVQHLATDNPSKKCSKNCTKRVRTFLACLWTQPTCPCGTNKPAMAAKLVALHC